MILSAILLAAGYGTRLYPLTEDCPKALLPLRNSHTVLLDPLMDNLSAVPGLGQVVLVTNHRFAGRFSQWAAERTRTLEILDDGTDTPQTRLGAVRDLLLAWERLPSDRDVVVLGTDNVFAWSLEDFATFARAKRPAATLAVRRAASPDEARRSGVIEMADDGRVSRFVEKPAVPPSLIIGLCVYYFPSPLRQRIRQFIQEGGNGDAPGYVIEWLASRHPVYGFLTGGEWFDIGTKDAYEHAIQRWRT